MTLSNLLSQISCLMLLALAELSVVARGQPCMMVGDFNVEPTKTLAWQKGFRLGSGLIWRRLGS